MRHAECCIYDDLLLRYQFRRVGFMHYMYRCFVQCQYCTPRIRAASKLKITKSICGFYSTRQRRRCRITGNSSFVVKHTGLHRLFTKYYIGLGFFKGYRRVGY